MTDALSIQHGGTHYKGLKIQPVVFGLMNNWDFAATSSLKYLSRYKDKGGLEDLKKARHFIELREQALSEIQDTYGWEDRRHAHMMICSPIVRISMLTYTKDNGLIGHDAEEALLELSGYVIRLGKPDRFFGAVTCLIDNYGVAA